MSMHLFRSDEGQLRILEAFENGSVSLFAYTGATERSVEGKGWEQLWNFKSHVESSEWVNLKDCSPHIYFFLIVMAMTVKYDNSAAYTVSADNLICKYDLKVR